MAEAHLGSPLPTRETSSALLTRLEELGARARDPGLNTDTPVPWEAREKGFLPRWSLLASSDHGQATAPRQRGWGSQAGCHLGHIWAGPPPRTQPWEATLFQQGGEGCSRGTRTGRGPAAPRPAGARAAAPPTRNQRHRLLATKPTPRPVPTQALRSVPGPLLLPLNSLSSVRISAGPGQVPLVQNTD